MVKRARMLRFNKARRAPVGSRMSRPRGSGIKHQAHKHIYTHAHQLPNSLMNTCTHRHTELDHMHPLSHDPRALHPNAPAPRPPHTIACPNARTQATMQRVVLTGPGEHLHKHTHTHKCTHAHVHTHTPADGVNPPICLSHSRPVGRTDIWEGFLWRIPQLAKYSRR